MAEKDFFLQRMKEAGLTYEASLMDIDIDPSYIDIISAETASEYRIIPVGQDDMGRITVVTYSDEALKKSDDISKIIGAQVKVLLTTELNFRQGLAKYYGLDNISSHRMSTKAISTEETSRLKVMLDRMMQDAAKKDVSDIHLLPTPNGMNVHFRIFGHYIDFSEDYRILPEEIPNVTSILLNNDTTRQASLNMPNAGSWDFVHDNITYFVRLSSLPISTTENNLNWHKIVLRLLPQNKKTVSLSELGYIKGTMNTIRSTLFKNSTGMFLLSGETGSGKTTTLYAMIDEQLKIRGEMQNVVTIENPVEIYDSRYCQAQVRDAVDERLALTPPKVLETVMRQDPNIILYGEIRTKKDAEIAVEAATTGHKVFSTVHARNAVSTLIRLFDLGVTRSSLLGQLNMIISQKLVGEICPDCSEEHHLTELESLILSDEEKETIAQHGNKLRQVGSIERVRNCPNKKCRNGYIGRIVIPEYIVFDTKLRDHFIRGDITFKEIQAMLNESGFVSMWTKAFRLVVEGKTDLKEALTVVGKED